MANVTRDDINLFFTNNVHLPTKTLYMGEVEGVDHRMAENVVKGLYILDNNARSKKITIIMNNIGGDEYHGLAIYDAIKQCKSPTHIKVYGHAMSMGAWILQAADKRYLSKHATVMLHYGTIGYEGHSKNFGAWSTENDRLSTIMEDHFLERIKEKHPRYTRTSLQEAIKFDKFLSASEAVELGLADKVI